MAQDYRELFRLGVATGSALLRRPHLWVTFFRQTVALAPTRWWAKAPHLPVPTSDYLRFRQVTATGKEGLPATDDLITWLEWCKSMRSLARGSRGN